MMTNEKMNICILSSDLFVPHSATLIASIMDNKDPVDDIVFHFFCENVTDRSKATLLSFARKCGFDIHFYDMKVDYFDGFPQTPAYQGSYMGYYKTVIPRLLPLKIDKALFLDSDMIVLTSLAPLYDTNIEGKYAAVVAERTECGAFCTHKELYFNAGMILLNVKKFREDHVEKKIIDLCSRRIQEAKWVEQDLLNEIFQGNVAYVPLKWNMLLNKATIDTILAFGGIIHPSEEEICEAEKDPHIVHYTAWKPWHHGCENPNRDFYWKYAQRTPFYKQVLSEYRQTLPKSHPSHVGKFLQAIKIPKRYFQCRIGKNGYLRLFGKTIFDFSKKTSQQTEKK